MASGYSSGSSEAEEMWEQKFKSSKSLFTLQKLQTLGIFYDTKETNMIELFAKFIPTLEDKSKGTSVVNDLFAKIAYENSKVSPQLQVLSMLMSVIAESLPFSLDNFNAVMLRVPSQGDECKEVKEKIDVNVRTLQDYKRDLEQRVQCIQEEKGLEFDSKQLALFYDLCEEYFVRAKDFLQSLKDLRVTLERATAAAMAARQNDRDTQQRSEQQEIIH